MTTDHIQALIEEMMPENYHFKLIVRGKTYLTTIYRNNEPVDSTHNESLTYALNHVAVFFKTLKTLTA